jgi:hypothetical protein
LAVTRSVLPPAAAGVVSVMVGPVTWVWLGELLDSMGVRSSWLRA